ncbi:MAG TPA: glycoside hydrolase family 3 C-terminal domain-containing protein [Terriglobales bacterium]|jgi:beta-glucosidase
MQKGILFLILAAAVLYTPAILGQAGDEQPAYLDPTRSIEQRIDDLMSRMTLEEKVGQLNLPCVYVDELGKDIPSKMEACRKFAAGTYTREIGPGCGFFTLANEILHKGTRQQVEYFNELQKIARTQTRLKIPLLEDEEGTHGAMFPGATIFPEGLAIGSTFDLELVKSVYASAAAEARAVGIHMLSTLVMELDRDPRMGRNEEAYTEDPYLYSRIAESIVRATQGSSIAAGDKVVAVLTDFPTQSEPASGLERGAIELSERALRENFLLPWVTGITKAGALGVMAGYPELEDVPAHASEKWTNDVLRQELGFRGVVVSEGGGFGTLLYEDIVRTQKEAGALALKAGVDVNITYEPAYMGPLVENVKEGRVPIALVDRAVRRVLELKFRLGLFKNSYTDVDHAIRTVHSQTNQDLALRAGREGIVLLKNDRKILPLKKNLKTIAVIGPDAENLMNELGDYSPHAIPQHVVSILEGIKAKAGPGTKVVAAKGCGVLGNDRSGFADATQAAKGADVAIVVVGENQGQNDVDEARDPPTDGEGHDVASLDLTGVQEDLVRAVYETGTPTVVVLVNGRPLSTRWIAEHVPAIVEAWRPGERGGEAVADVLFGDYNPSGRLAITIPRHVGQLPAYYNYKPAKRYWIKGEKRGYVDMPATPLYPFGFGLSYTTYQYSGLRIDPLQIHSAGTARVSVEVKNAGDQSGTETVQLYVHRTTGPVATPVKQLRGFERVDLNPGETKNVTLTLTPEDLQLLDRDMHWRVTPGDVEIMVGSSSDDLPLQGVLKVVP